MNRIALVLLLLVPALAFADRSIQGDKKATIDCSKDPEVSIQSGEGTFTFTGTCDKITVTGGGNTVTIENVKKLAIVGASNTLDIGGADKISITGSSNKVTYKSTVKGTGKPVVATLGNDNKISKK
ncbi:MAG: DUF3060 domain-containing protein [Deltaproteobacteria bacterium]|nr:DUF3060 domain-containing protein [Deltaproteobacteria bacterium]